MATFEGLRKLERKLDKLGRVARGKALRSAGLAAMLPPFREAKASAPVGSPPYGPYGARRSGIDPYPTKTHKGQIHTEGLTRRSIARKTKLSPDGRKVVSMLGVRPRAYYALSFLELGTSRMAKQPWLEPIFRRNERRAIDTFGDRLKKRIEKAAK